MTPAPEDLAARLKAALLATPDRVLVHHRDWAGGARGWTGREIWEEARAFDHLHCSTDVTWDGCIGWLAPNHPLMFATLWGCAAYRIALVPLNHRLTVEELRAINANAGFGWLRGGADRHFLHPFVHGYEGWAGADLDGSHQREPDPDLAAADAPLLFAYTSGSTGAAKGAVLTQRAVAANIAHAQALFGFTPEDRVLTVLPMFHMGGLAIQTLPALLAGSTLILHARFDADAFFDCVEQERPTLTLLVPAVMAALVAHPRWAAADLSSLRAIGAGSSEVPLALIEAFHAKGVPVQQVYGMTEAGPIAIAQPVEEAWAHPGSLGFPVGACEARLDPATGEIQLRGPNLFTHYHGAPEATAAAFTEDGWFRTGDAGRVDAAGRWWFTGRLSRVIISGGENIHPAELERVLETVPGLREFAVIGRPDPRWGEVPVAVIVEGEGFEEARLHAAFAAQLARFKHPRAVLRVPALPRTALGKVEMGKLAAMLADQRV